MITEFWQNKNEIEDTQQLKEYFIECFRNDFTDPDQYTNVWKNVFINVNQMLYENLHINKSKWKDITYDQYVKSILEFGSKHIEEFKDIYEEDMIKINEDVMYKHLFDLGIIDDNTQVPKIQKQNATISDIMNSIKLKAR